jgi:hypothetical protein
MLSVGILSFTGFSQCTRQSFLCVKGRVPEEWLAGPALFAVCKDRSLSPSLFMFWKLYMFGVVRQGYFRHGKDILERPFLGSKSVDHFKVVSANDREILLLE